MSSQSPLSPKEIVDEYFIENRTRLLEIAAFLDRLDRADSAYGGRDFRMKAFTEALASMAQGSEPNPPAFETATASVPSCTPTIGA